jgi:hypothetical protein
MSSIFEIYFSTSVIIFIYELYELTIESYIIQINIHNSILIVNRVLSCCNILSTMLTFLTMCDCVVF